MTGWGINMETKMPIRSFKDLLVYQNLYNAMKIVMIEIVTKLPVEEKYNLVDQMRRCSQAGPALVAEGFAKRFQKRQWDKYLNDAIGESSEMIHHLSVCIDIYPNYVDVELCKKVIDTYDICGKQLTKLGQAWKNFHNKALAR